MTERWTGKQKVVGWLAGAFGASLSFYLLSMPAGLAIDLVSESLDVDRGDIDGYGMLALIATCLAIGAGAGRFAGVAAKPKKY